MPPHWVLFVKLPSLTLICYTTFLIHVSLTFFKMAYSFFEDPIRCAVSPSDGFQTGAISTNILHSRNIFLCWNYIQSSTEKMKKKITSWWGCKTFYSLQAGTQFLLILSFPLFLLTGRHLVFALSTVLCFQGVLDLTSIYQKILLKNGVLIKNIFCPFQLTLFNILCSKLPK